MKTFSYCAVIGVLAALMWGSVVTVARGEIVVEGGEITVDSVWTKEEGPYVLSGSVIVPAEVRLTVESGVVISSSPAEEEKPSLIIEGTLIMRGTETAPITVRGLYEIAVDDSGHADISYLDSITEDGISFTDAGGFIASSTILSAGEGISAKGSRVFITGSKLNGNKYGVVVESVDPPVLIRSNDQLYGRGGEGNAYEQLSHVVITGSSITNSQRYAIRNDDPDSTVDAKHNWWGSPMGPDAAILARIAGPVEYDPWLMEDPLVVSERATCCSSVLFIPGLQATRLYSDTVGVAGTSTNMLWEPNRNDDVRMLYLDEQGKSLSDSVYSGEPIDRAFGLVDVYGPFLSFLDSLKERGVVTEWKSFGYDWRKSIPEVVTGSEKKSTTTESLIPLVEELAARSPTGKVSVIAHSNGGLVMKYLVKTLADMGKEHLIDTVVSVAVPHLGTPQALAALLHGYDQSLAYGLIQKPSVARALGANMASAYSLLPSGYYFLHALGPTIAFASTSMLPGIAGIGSVYPQEIVDIDSQSDFVGDRMNTRPASSADTSIPLKGNPELLSAADSLHAILDSFEWPVAISRWAIVGWNKITTKGIEYSNKKVCVYGSSGCMKELVYHATTTLLGDGTVVVPSAAWNSGTIAALDLEAESEREGKNVKHMSILGSATVRSILEKLIGMQPAEGEHVVISEIKDMPGVTIEEPTGNGEPSFVKVSTHSPVELHVYDSKGWHTGIITPPGGADIEDGLYTMYEEHIPGSTFDSLGSTDEDPEYQVYIPNEPGHTYTIEVRGIGVGEFTLDIEQVHEGVLIEKVEFAHLPVTPLMVASTSIMVSEFSAGSISSLASSTPPLTLDVNGDGSADIRAVPSANFDPIVHLEALKKTVQTVMGSAPRGKNLIKRIERLQELVRKGKFKQTRVVAERLRKRMANKGLKRLSENDRNQIISQIELFISQFE